jgi:hypothetical protein
MPMITAGQRPIFATDETTLNALMGEFDPRATVYLPSSETSRLPFTNGTAARILSQKVEPHRIEAVVETPERAVVVIAQTFYHRWKPTVDGQPAVLLRANHAFQAIAVPAGRHEVRLVYDDPAFRWGRVISAIALLACLGMAIPRRRPHSSPTVD